MKLSIVDPSVRRLPNGNISRPRRAWLSPLLNRIANTSSLPLQQIVAEDYVSVDHVALHGTWTVEELAVFKLDRTTRVKKADA